MAGKQIVWDAPGSRYFENGVSKGVLYPMTESGDYGVGVAWNGLTTVTESPSGAEANDIYADNIKYATLRSAETFGGTIEAYTYPDEFSVCDGSVSPAKGVNFGQQKRRGFGLSYVTNVGNDTATESDDGYKLHLIYGATAAPSERSYTSTNDAPDAMSMSWEISTVPVSITNDDLRPVSTITIDTTKLDEAGKTALKSLETMLYGSATKDPELPLPGDVYALFKDATTLPETKLNNESH
jgi:hypothetical protein